MEQHIGPVCLSALVMIETSTIKGRLFCALLSLMLCVGSLGCSSDGESRGNSADPDSRPAFPKLSPKTTGGTGAEPRPTDDLTPPPRPVIAREKLAKALNEVAQNWSDRERRFVDDYEQLFTKLLAKPRWFRKLTTRAYTDRKNQLIFSHADAPNQAAVTMIEHLDNIELHGLDPAPYQREALNTVLTRIEERRRVYGEVVNAGEDAQELALWKAVERIRHIGSSELNVVVRVLQDAELDDTQVHKVGRLEDRLNGIFRAKAALNEAMIDLDILLLANWFRYCYDMRFALRAHPFDANADDGAGVTKVAEELWNHFTTTDFADLGSYLSALEPRHPEYRALMDGLAFYRQLDSEKRHIRLPKKAARLTKGAKKDTVKVLQERLLAEGYYEGEPSGVYDDATFAAVELYQQVHQLKETGEMNRPTLSSLNKDFATRAEQIRLGLQRHRESELHQGEWRFGEAAWQIRVNIPQFEAFVYHQGELVKRHRIVVGNNNVEVDENTGLKGYFNRTRMFSRELKTVVLNPTWRVPKRIKEQELDRQLIDEPDYYERNNYRVRTLDDGSEEVVQLPGPKNALGLVKFLFPNQFSIYMHDTPKKRLFKREIRAFSHGCMRVHEAVDFARFVVTKIIGWPESRFDRVMDSRETYGIAVKEKLPITIDYNTVGMHSSGKVMFFSDIYRFDRDYRSGKTPYTTRPGRRFEQVVLKE